TLIAAALLLATPAHAIVGGGTPQTDGVARAVVTIVGSRGNFCTGTLIAPKLVLTVAHCVQPGADYKIVDRGADGAPQLLNVRTAPDPAGRSRNQRCSRRNWRLHRRFRRSRVRGQA